MKVRTIQAKTAAGDRPWGANQSSMMLMASGTAPKIMKTRRLPKRGEDMRSVSQPAIGSLIASQNLPTKSALPTSAGEMRAASV
jgi:hypothetical protein